MLCRALIAVLALAPGGTALRVSPSPLTTRRSAIMAGASIVPAVVLPTLAAHADDDDDAGILRIAQKNAEAAKLEAERKKQAQESKGLLDAAEGGLNTVLTVGAVGILGFAGVTLSGFLGKSQESSTVNLDRNRFLTDAERRKYAKLSASEKKKLGIKDL